MAELKTQRNAASVEDFINSQPADRQEDCRTLVSLMSEVSGEKPEMWGNAIIGFGCFKYKSKGGTADWMKVAFSPRKKDLSIYIMDGVKTHADLLTKLGKQSCGMCCLYIRKLSDVDLDILREMIQNSLKNIDSGSWPHSVV